ncbi:MAG: hypothetical protein QF578_08120 [Alphaproteobacteria bacterium]|jgi:hypothetical protein|nr:hypothetical protein [Alphaproteobacteria bacterium]
MLRKFFGIFSRITSALEDHAVRHPTHFPAVSSAMDLQEEETADEPQQAGETTESKDDRQSR